jgi:hypothetical protein
MAEEAELPELVGPVAQPVGTDPTHIPPVAIQPINDPLNPLNPGARARVAVAAVAAPPAAIVPGGPVWVIPAGHGGPGGPVVARPPIGVPAGGWFGTPGTLAGLLGNSDYRLESVPGGLLQRMNQGAYPDITLNPPPVGAPRGAPPPVVGAPRGPPAAAPAAAAGDPVVIALVNAIKARNGGNGAPAGTQPPAGFATHQVNGFVNRIVQNNAFPGGVLATYEQAILAGLNNHDNQTAYLANLAYGAVLTPAQIAARVARAVFV